MGKRYESRRSEVRDSREDSERIQTDQGILKEEYSFLSAISDLLSDVDDEVMDVVTDVSNVGTQESTRLEEEKKENEEEKEKIADEIDHELSKLYAGLEKMNSLEQYGYGKGSVEQSKSEYQVQIEKFKELKQELLEAAESGNIESIGAVVAENSELIGSLYENDSEKSDSLSHANQFATQKEHRPLVSSHDGAISAVIEDLKIGSGKEISVEEAERLYKGVNDFSGEYSDDIRSAYNNPNADEDDIERMKALDEYINNAPKWEGQVYRGIHVTQKVADEILSNPTVDMRGAASWSSELNVAERFSIDTMGDDDIHMIFVLPENKSGASITHIARYNGIESEVTSPSGVQYNIDQVSHVYDGNREYIYVYVHE